MDTMFMNSKDEENFDPNRPLFNLTDNIDFKKVINMLFL